MSHPLGRAKESETALILGSAGDIGLAVSCRAKAKGWHVIGVDRLPGRDPDTDSTRLTLDLSMPEALDELSTLVRAESPRAVVCALGAPATADYDEVLNANFVNPARALHRVVAELNAGAAITVVTSVSASLPAGARSRLNQLVDHPESIHEILAPKVESGSAAYALAKGAMTEWTLQHSARFVRRLRFNVVTPISTTGSLQADYARSAPRGSVERGRSILGRDVSPRDVADAVDLLTLEPSYWWLNGSVVRVDGGLMNYLRRDRG